MNQNLEMKLKKCTYGVLDDALECVEDGCVQVRIPLNPVVDGRKLTFTQWELKHPGHFLGRLNSGDEVHLAEEYGLLCIWMESRTGQFDSLTYFPGITFSGRYWHTFMSDEHDRKWNVQIDQEVGISSAYGPGENPFRTGWDGGGMTDPGDLPPYWIWNVPCRAFAVQSQTGWTGFLVPGALPVGLTRLSMRRGALSVAFDSLRPSCEGGMMPRVYLVPGLSDPYDALAEYRRVSDDMGLTAKKASENPSWWANPFYKYWDEYCRQGYANPTAEKYLDWLKITRDKVGMRELNVTLEQGCFDYYGSYTPLPEMGGVDGVRKMVDNLRKEGTHVGHYINPYVVNTKCEFWREHPEAFCSVKPGVKAAAWPLDGSDGESGNVQLDWTHPLARKFIADKMRFLYSDEPGCLNCDIVRSNNWVTPDPRVFDFHDPDWGIGDLMTLKVQNFIFETAKTIKSDILVTKVSAGDPFMQPWLDLLNMSEEWNGSTANWYRRGRIITRTMPDVPRFTDAWFVTITKGYEYYMGMLAWNLPETESVEHAIHPYLTYRPLGDKDFKRRKAGFQAYVNAPLRYGDISRVEVLDGDEVIQWRKRTEGPLADFYAAIGIDKRTLVTYSEKEARIATSICREVDIPLPPGAKVTSVTGVSHNGSDEDCVYELVTLDGMPGLRMHIEDCGGSILYYRVSYLLSAD